ncbi:MAG: AmmeMemoRadiSam system protein B [Verrucomicrobiota bacterium]
MSVRSAAAAGRFYPGSASEIRVELDRYFSNAAAEPDAARARAVMLPHAGWVFCGDIIAETLARTRIPKTIIIIGPKHTPYGPSWSVSNDSAWSLPTGEIPVATDSVQFLNRCNERIKLDRDAHRFEHGCEVLLPFLQRLRADIQIVPIAIGTASYDECLELGSNLRQLLDEADEAPLMVISSDMNHFATDAENRRRDHLALQQLQNGDAKGLYEVCQENEISICGVYPASAVMSAISSSWIEVTRYETSARINGDKNNVVGYAGALFC